MSRALTCGALLALALGSPLLAQEDPSAKQERLELRDVPPAGAALRLGDTAAETAA